MLPRPRSRLVLLPAAAILIALIYLLVREREFAPTGSGYALSLAAVERTAQFERALEPRPFSFPRDHGPHPTFQTEWWYYTGNLRAADGRRFGYQLTFFRRALSPMAPERASAFAASQIYFAHFALTDVQGRQHLAFERFSRAAAGLAGAQGEPLRVWIEAWRAEALDEAGEQVHLRAAQGDAALDLRLAALKPLTLHGEAGLSRKSQDPGNASYYLSFTRMETSGTLTIAGERYEVEGLSWFDHEWSTSALGEGAVGWDWIGLHLDDGSDLMLARIRRADGTVEPASGGTLVESDGSAMSLHAGDFEMEPLASWSSPHSGARYPTRWRVLVPRLDMELLITALVEDQENDLSVVYWEGAVRVEGTRAGEPLSGFGYLEMTGYAESLEGSF
jgi:predicted secreted hydrolase